MPATEAMLTIAPLPCSTMIGSTYLQPRKAVFRLKSIWRSQTSSVIETGSPGAEPPTLLTRMSIRLKRSTQACTISRTSAAMVMSQRCVAHVPPSASMIERVSATASSLMSSRKTAAPWRASRTAVALPLPQIWLPAGPTDPAPATIATFPAMLSIRDSSQRMAFK